VARRRERVALEILRRIETQRLVLRPPGGEDAAAIYAYASEPQVCRYLAWPRHQSIADTHRFLETAQLGWQHGDRLSWVVEDDGAVVGMIGAELGRGGAGIGYVFAREVWGRGYASEVLAAVSSALLAQAPLRSLWAFCVPENAASARVLEKCCFSRERLLPDYFECPNLGTEKHDVVLYVRHRLSACSPPDSGL
jgi:RimJ/RimL family protein N-acetyltransferase